MWHPWYRGHGYVRADGVGYEAGWWEPVRKVNGVRAWASICYDQLLPWVWLEGVIQAPQVVLLTNNEWWARGTGIPEIQRATAWAWVRLIGAPVVEAENA
ncbi:conjugal transfer protein TraB [Acidithiobacillus sp. GGI-221]|nr:conjugal transfer protein TraB [Acidithiobacillus sp. GGI-221]